MEGCIDHGNNVLKLFDYRLVCQRNSLEYSLEVSKIVFKVLQTVA